MSSHRNDDHTTQVVQWGVGCLVAAAALVGTVILAFLLAFALQPPAWVQVLVGLGLVLGGALLAWLVSSAVAQSRADRRGPQAVEQPPKD